MGSRWTEVAEQLPLAPASSIHRAEGEVALPKLSGQAVTGSLRKAPTEFDPPSAEAG